MFNTNKALYTFYTNMSRKSHIVKENTSYVSTEYNPILFVPRVHHTVTEDEAFKVFKELKIGFVKQIDLPVVKKGDKVIGKRMYIRFRYWNKSYEAEDMRKRIWEGDKVRIMYNKPFYWDVVKSGVPMRSVNAPATKVTQSRRPRERVVIDKPVILKAESPTDESPSMEQYKALLAKLESSNQKIIELEKKLEEMQIMSSAPSSPPKLVRERAVDPKSFETPPRQVNKTTPSADDSFDWTEGMTTPPARDYCQSSPAYIPDSPAYSPDSPAYSPGTPSEI